MSGFQSYSSAWVANAYVEKQAEDFTYNPQRGEQARAVPAPSSRRQEVDTTTAATDPTAIGSADEFYGQDHDGFPDTMPESWPVRMGDDAALKPREGYHLWESRSVDNGAPARWLRAFTAQTPSSEHFATATEYDPEAYLLPDPTGPDAERLIRGGPGAFNAYNGTNSFARKPMETFVREDRLMLGGNLDNPHDIRPLYYNRGESAVNIPYPGPAEHGWGFVYDAWETGVPDERLAQAPYDRREPASPSLTADTYEGSENVDWGVW